MDIKTRHIGSGKTALIEITVTDWSGNSSITEDVTDLNGKVDEKFIMALRQIANELEEQNNKIS
jgi:Ni2+-binding GTPase involved in maturation of urease and hydrogenase